MQKVQLVKAKTFELDPTKRYLIVFDKSALSREGIQVLAEQLHKEGITSVAIVSAVPDAMKVVEVAES